MQINQHLLSIAAWRVRNDQALEKTAIVPAGGGDPSGGMGGMGGDPSGGMGGGMAPGGAAPPMDPASMGGAPPAPDPAAAAGGAPIDPAIQMAITQAVQQAMGGGGGPGMAGGKPGMMGGKKAEQAMLDTKLWQILKMLAAVMNHMGIPVPADIVVGAPPDPGTLQMANQDNASALNGSPDMSGGGGGAPPGGGGAPPPGGGIEPVSPMDAGGDMGVPTAASYFGYDTDDEDDIEIGSVFHSPTARSLGERAEAFAAIARRRNAEMAS